MNPAISFVVAVASPDLGSRLVEFFKRFGSTNDLCNNLWLGLPVALLIRPSRPLSCRDPLLTRGSVTAASGIGRSMPFSRMEGFDTEV